MPYIPQWNTCDICRRQVLSSATIVAGPPSTLPEGEKTEKWMSCRICDYDACNTCVCSSGHLIASGGCKHGSCGAALPHVPGQDTRANVGSPVPGAVRVLPLIIILFIMAYIYIFKSYFYCINNFCMSVKQYILCVGGKSCHMLRLCF